jgi:aspartate/methionine/tyrosine aminotransferase
MPRGSSQRAQGFTESVIRQMTRLSEQYDAVNLAQGFPDFDPPNMVKQAAARAIRDGYNQYSTPYGIVKLRQAIARKLRIYNHVDYDPDSEITVTCGTTEGMIASLLALLDHGDEVVIFEPFYENYGPDSILSGARCRYVKLRPPEFKIEEEALKQAFTKKTKAIIINTPHNPTGRVFTRDELGIIRDLCLDHDAYAVTDEIYDQILYDGRKHVSIASLEGMRDRTIAILGFSKTYSMTGWRVGYVAGEKTISQGIRKVHDFLTVCAPTPLQQGCITALSLPQSYYDKLCKRYDQGRLLLLDALSQCGFEAYKPEGAYYIWTNIRGTNYADDRMLAEYLVSKVGIGSVPGSSFYHKPADGKLNLRFSFSKQPATIRTAVRRLSRFRSGPGRVRNPSYSNDRNRLIAPETVAA